MWRKFLLASLFIIALMVSLQHTATAVAKQAIPSSQTTLVVPLENQTQESEGRDISRQDWLDRLPLMIIMIIVVIAVDAIFIAKIVADRRQEQNQA